MSVRRVAIANRGEVAARIIRACEELGLETVLLHSEADIHSRAYRMATKKICIGAAPVAESYLNIPANITGALAGGADAIHPGFGFLSENSDFALACRNAKINFIGPSPEAMKMLGDKVNCKALAKKMNLPLIPGYEGSNQDLDHLEDMAKFIKSPVLVKAAAGGGGRGMKLIRDLSESRAQIESAQREALGAFGSKKVFLEKYLEHAKHIEFQIFVDASGQVWHFNERECSVQRRHQKIIEESLSPSLDQDLRERMAKVACDLVGAAGYKGAATVEFLLQDDEFFLLEVNTRLQVEHPVTEMVMGIDLVKAQILTAMGQSVFPFEVANRGFHGHAIECRLYAEDPYNNGMPSVGKLSRVSFPEGPGRRFEYGFEEGDVITSFYDPMIAKVIVWDETRARAIQKMVRVLSDTVIFGVKTNIPLLKDILLHPEFVSGRMTTRFFEKFFPESLKAPATNPLKDFAVNFCLQNTQGVGLSPAGPNKSENPFLHNWKNS